MPWTNPSTFTVGQVLTSTAMNIVSNNARMGQPVFTNEAARDSAITSPEEGMIAYLTAPTVPAATGSGSGSAAVPTGITTTYNGSAWVCTTPVCGYSTGSATLGTNAGYVNVLTGDATQVSVTLSTGTTALIHMSAVAGNNTVGAAIWLSVAVSGATTLAASDNNATLANAPVSTYNLSVARSFVLTGLTAGTNTFTLNYRTNLITTTYGNRNLVVQGVA